MIITLTVSPTELETIIACLAMRARTIGGDTKNDRTEQERLYRLAADLDRRSTTLIQPATTEETHL